PTYRNDGPSTTSAADRYTVVSALPCCGANTAGDRNSTASASRSPRGAGSCAATIACHARRAAGRSVIAVERRADGPAGHGADDGDQRCARDGEQPQADSIGVGGHVGQGTGVRRHRPGADGHSAQEPACPPERRQPRALAALLCCQPGSPDVTHDLEREPEVDEGDDPAPEGPATGATLPIVVAFGVDPGAAEPDHEQYAQNEDRDVAYLVQPKVNEAAPPVCAVPGCSSWMASLTAMTATTKASSTVRT